MQRAQGRTGASHNFWMTGFGGFALGVITVLIVLFVARRIVDREPAPPTSGGPVEVAPDEGHLEP